MDNNWQTKEINIIFKELRSGEHGLKEEEVKFRLREYGPNKLPSAQADSLFIVFWRQFKSPLIFILFVASMVIFLMGEIVDGSIILFVLLFNALIGTIQEGRAQNTLAALKKLVEAKATVLREGKEIIIPDIGLVPGDIIILQEGEKIPADARIIISNNLKIDEAALTGESVAVHKVKEKIRDGALASEKVNMVFKGTTVVSGNGKVIAVATGLNTEIGKISKEILTIDTEIPLKENIRYLSRLIIMAVAGISSALFVLGIILGKSLKEMFTTVVSLSVSIIPEGLPIVITLVLATGVWRMSKRNVLVRRLQAVEALGQASVIAVDKTGTITKNEMVVQKAYTNNKFFQVSGVGYESDGEITYEGKVVESLNHPELLLTGKIAAFCANARIMFLENEKEWKISGDPTEAALLTFSKKVGFCQEDLEEDSPRIWEIPFDYQNRYHAVCHRVDGKEFLAVVGAPEKIINLCDSVWLQEKSAVLTKEEKEKLEQIFLKLLKDGFRVVALAMQEGVFPAAGIKKIENLTFVGFLAMKDALRPEIYEAMRKAISAGIRVIMISGDHKITARTIAEEAAVFRAGDAIVTGEEIDKLSDAELIKLLPRITVFARVTPEHKLRIIQAYKKRGDIIAMTGDGVNDAPSLVAADLGVAMGKIGTEVAKEAADIVLLDDNFGSIISAVEEGRSIYKTIKKVILYLFSTSVGEILTIAGAILLGFPLPLLAAQIIWLNLVTDSFLDVALAMEPKEDGLLRRNFTKPKKYFLDSLIIKRIFLMAVPMTAGALFLFSKYFEANLIKAWTISLTTLAVFQWFNAWNCRHESKSIFQQNPFSNLFLVGATIIVFLLQILAIYNPVMQSLLRTSPLVLNEWITIILVASSIVVVEEIRKFFYRRQVAN